MSKPSTTLEMGATQFWGLVSRSREGMRGNAEKQLKSMTKLLGALEPVEIAGYELAFRRAWYEAYTWNLWGAAYLIGGGCSDDSFMDFRTGLIAAGENVYRKALENPDTLAELDDAEELFFEEFAYLAKRVYDAKTGQELDVSDAALQARFKKPSGRRWDFEDEAKMEKRFPRLWEAYGD